MTVQANTNLTTAKYSLILKGESNNSNTVERLAFGLIVEGGTLSCDDDLVVSNSGSSISNGIYQASETIISNSRVASNDNVTFRAGESITLLSGFEALNGSQFLAEIGACTGNATNLEEERKQITAMTESAIVSPKSKIQLAPNPALTTTQIQLELTDDEQVVIYLYDVNGKQIRQIQPMQTLVAGIHTFEIPIADLGAGLYFIEVQMKDKQLREKLVVMK